MPWTYNTLVASLITCLVLSLVYLVAYGFERNRCLVVWGAGWAACGLRFSLPLFTTTWPAGWIVQPGLYLQATILLSSLASCGLLLWGMLIWLGQPVTWKGLVVSILAGVLWGASLMWGNFLLVFPMQLALGLGLGLAYFEKARQSIEHRQARLQAIFDNASLGIGMENGRGRFIQINQSLVSMLGYTPEEALNLSFDDITYPDDLPMTKSEPMLGKGLPDNRSNGNGNGNGRNKIPSNGSNGNGGGISYSLENSQVEKRFVRKDGSVFWGGLALSPIRGPAGDVVAFAGMITDLSQHKQTEEALRRKTSQQERLITTARQLTQSLEVNQVLRQIATGAWEILGANSCAIYLLEPGGKQLNPVVAIDPTYAEATLSSPIPVEDSFTGQSVKARRGLIFNNAHLSDLGVQIPGTPSREQEHIMVAPLIVDDQVLGAMCLNQLQNSLH